jgi:hypothetical protein
VIEKYKLVTSNKSALIEALEVMLSQNEAVQVTAKPWSRKRSLPANSQVYVWCAHIAKLEGESAESVRNFCKLMFGLPILLQDENYKDKISWTLNKLGFYNWNHEQQVNYMELLPVSSLFNTKQHNEYRDNMQAYYAKNGVMLDYVN